MKKVNTQAVFGSQYWMPLAPWIAEKAKSDPDILLISQDGQLPPNTQWGPDRTISQGLNPNNPEVMKFAEDYLSKFAAHIKDRADFILTGWEDLNIIQVGADSAMRSIGYNPSNKTAFRAYLKERYGSIEELNKKWKSNHASFDAIEPPDDKFLKPATQASGLTYVFARWLRVNHIRSNAAQRRFIKHGAPKVPVMIDDSNFLLDGNGYLLMKENAADIFSFHSSPGNEEMMWTALGSIGRRFDKVLGYMENYWGMYRNSVMADERLSKRALRQLFFTLYGRDIRYSTWWLNYFLSNTDYSLAYGGGVFGLDYDQTILRWSSTELVPMFARGKAVEGALLDSRPETPRTAILQPCSALYNLASMGKTYRDSPVALTTLSMFNRILQPWNIPSDVITEEMVLDGMAKLDSYDVLLLPNGVYMDPKLAEALTQWIRRGGTLLAVGPFALADQYGFDLPTDTAPLKQLFPESKRTGPGGWDFDAGPKAGMAGKVKPQSLGKGKVIYLDREVETILRDPANVTALRQALSRTAPAARAANPSLRLLLREGVSNEKYLLVGNRDLEKPVEAKVNLRGHLASAIDVTVPGGFAMPFKAGDSQSDLSVYLEPGDFCLVQLRFDAAR